MGIPVYLISLDPWDSMPGDPGCPGYPRTLRDLILGCPMYLGMSRVVLGQAVAVLDIPQQPINTLCKYFQSAQHKSVVFNQQHSTELCFVVS